MTLLVEDGVLSYMVYIGFCDSKGKDFQPFSSYIGCGSCTVVMNWVCFFEKKLLFQVIKKELGKIARVGHKEGEVFGNKAAHPFSIFLGIPVGSRGDDFVLHHCTYSYQYVLITSGN